MHVLKFLYYLNNIKVFHWVTKSHSKHIATDQLLHAIDTKIDKFMEIYTIKYGIVEYTGVCHLQLENLTNETIAEYVTNFHTFVNADVRELIRDSDRDLHNLLDDIDGDINQCLYRLAQSG